MENNNSKPKINIDFSQFSNDALIKSNKDLALVYTRAMINSTKNNNNLEIQTAVKNYKLELDASSIEIKKRNL
jgi:hypothetical protein